MDFLNALADQPYLRNFFSVLCILLVAALSYALAKRIIVRVIHAFLAKTKNKWDDVLIKHKVFVAISLFLPAIVFFYAAALFPAIEPYIRRAVHLYVIVLCVMLVIRMLSCGQDVYESSALARTRPLKGYIQLVKIFVVVVGLVLIVSLILDKSPWVLLSGIGAVMAILLLVFKDTILSLVASIQIASNDLLCKGDWIDMPQFGADGDVIDIALHTVKVQNWDKTIVSIPTQKFLDHSFKNWRGMQQAGGRRIKRSILIDQSSIRFLDQQLWDRLSKIGLLREYLERKKQEIDDYNRTHELDAASLVNGRRLTNIGTLRAYILAYLRQHTGIRQDLTLMVRHLQPEADSGLPVEVYAFTSDTAWGVYEGIQADIFDHILAIIPEFGLRAYQRNALRDQRDMKE